MEYEFTTTVAVEEWDRDVKNPEDAPWGSSEADAWDILFDRLYGGRIHSAQDLRRVFRSRVTAATEPAR